MNLRSVGHFFVFFNNLWFQFFKKNYIGEGPIWKLFCVFEVSH
jgi:hypothetical protein